MVQPLWEMVWHFFRRFSIETPYDPAIPLLGIYPREMTTHDHTKTCTQTFTAILVITEKGGITLNVHKMMNGEIRVEPCNAVLLSHKKE